MVALFLTEFVIFFLAYLQPNLFFSRSSMHPYLGKGPFEEMFIFAPIKPEFLVWPKDTVFTAPLEGCEPFECPILRA